MEENEQKTVVVKISMPRTMAGKFIEECRLNFNDSRWLKIKFDNAMFTAMYQIQPEEIKKQIIAAREEMKELIKEMYEVELK
jgi:hypothetical protein